MWNACMRTDHLKLPFVGDFSKSPLKAKQLDFLDQAESDGYVFREGN